MILDYHLLGLLSSPLRKKRIFPEYHPFRPKNFSRVQHPCLARPLASICDTRNFNIEDLSFSQDSSELCERKDNRRESGISNKVPSLLVSYLSDLLYLAIQITLEIISDMI